MNFIGACLIISGIISLIRYILSRDKIGVYSKKTKMIILKKEEFLKTQLYFYILISIYAIVVGAVVIFFNINIIYVYILLFIGAIAKKLFMIISKVKGNIKFSKI